MLRLRTAVVAGALSLAAATCGQRERPGAFQPAEGGSGGTADAGLDIQIGGSIGAPCGIEPETPICGDQVIPAIEDPPNLYFVIDSSGSMAEFSPGGVRSKYEDARLAVSVLLDAIGHRVSYGAAIFPTYLDNPDGCLPGVEIFPTRRGDPPCRTADAGRGPTLAGLLTQLGFVTLGGGTPVATSIDAIAPTLLALSGKTWVVLITDGAPNCNYDTSCGSDTCIPNIEGASFEGQPCSASLNCCDPSNIGAGAQGACIDIDGSERAIADLNAQGISTFVIGMPGSEPYSVVLDRMAVAGGTARAEAPLYYSTSDTESLTEALLGIGTGVAIHCEIPLAELPPDQDLVNVYFDGHLVVYDEADGWAWSGAQTLEIRGEACARLRSGSVFEVQILAGCQTVVR